MKPPLTIEQSSAVFERLEDLPIVLIGGQALNYWCNFYAASTPELAERVYTSKDVDFQGTLEDLVTAAIFRLYRVRGHRRAGKGLTRLTDWMAHSSLPELGPSGRP